MSRNERQTFAGILIVIIIILLGILTQITSGFLGLIIGFLGLFFFFAGAYLINLYIVEIPETEEARIRRDYEEKEEKLRKDFEEKEIRIRKEYEGKGKKKLKILKK